MVFLNEDKIQCVITCDCGCMEGASVSIDKEYPDTYCFSHLLSSQWNVQQYGLMWKLKKIWTIIKGKDFYYSELVMTKDDFEKYKEFVNRF